MDALDLSLSQSTMNLALIFKLRTKCLLPMPISMRPTWLDLNNCLLLSEQKALPTDLVLGGSFIHFLSGAPLGRLKRRPTDLSRTFEILDSGKPLSSTHQLEKLISSALKKHLIHRCFSAPRAGGEVTELRRGRKARDIT